MNRCKNIYFKFIVEPASKYTLTCDTKLVTDQDLILPLEGAITPLSVPLDFCFSLHETRILCLLKHV